MIADRCDTVSNLFFTALATRKFDASNEQSKDTLVDDVPSILREREKKERKREREKGRQRERKKERKRESLRERQR